MKRRDMQENNKSSTFLFKAPQYTATPNTEGIEALHPKSAKASSSLVCKTHTGIHEHPADDAGPQPKKVKVYRSLAITVIDVTGVSQFASLWNVKTSTGIREAPLVAHWPSWAEKPGNYPHC